MLSYAEIKQAFDSAIKNVGISNLKKTSFFASNTRSEANNDESKAA